VIVGAGPAVRSDEELIEHVRETAETLFHPVGTCKMSADETAVVGDRREGGRSRPERGLTTPPIGAGIRRAP